jgi:hypothetical protein
MHTRSFSIHQRMPRSVRKDQKRTALQLLALSGVVRPSDVELRYSTWLRSWEPITFHLKQIWQWVSSLGMAEQRPRSGVR